MKINILAKKKGLFYGINILHLRTMLERKNIKCQIRVINNNAKGCNAVVYTENNAVIDVINSMPDRFKIKKITEG